MKKMRLFSAILSLCLLSVSLLSVPACAVADIDIAATHTLLIDVEHDEVLYAQAADEKAYPASITKVMTALLVLEAVDRGELSLDTVITASGTFHTGLTSDGSTQNIQTGETLSVRNLLYCLLLPSANEAANILAETVSGSVRDFVKLMNVRAEELGCTGTHFTNATGLHDDDHYTTAHDIYRFAKEAMTHDTFRQIVSTSEYYVPATNLSEQRHLINTNALLSNLKYRGYVYQYAIGIKTGSTDEAGVCLVAAAEKDDITLISVVLGAQNVTREDGTMERQNYSESKRLLQWGFDNFTYQTILDSNLPLAEVAVTLSKQADYVVVETAQALSCMLPKDLDPTAFEQNIQLISDSVEAPVEEGQIMGTVTISYDGVEYGTVDLVAVNSVERSNLLYRTDRLRTFLTQSWVSVIMATVFLFAAIIVFRLIAFRKRRRYSSRPTRRGRYTGRKR